MKIIPYTTILIAFSACSLFATTVMPLEIESKNAGNGDTSHENVNCRFTTCSDPNLIQGYLTINGDLLKELNVSMRLEKDGETLASVHLDGYEGKSDAGKSRIFNFAVHPEMLEESFIEIFSDPFDNGQYLRIKMSKVEVLKHMKVEEGK